ncbi:hypothetical protein HZB03_02425 [Candidatus Woesearchaeota archaeon]|nr:hypothetical protein [Candidatus Woesearchaeota archaeon]
MKRVAGLASIVLTAGISASASGCGSTLVPYGMGRFTENTTLNVSSESLPCSKAEVWMDKKGYMIQCDEKHGFQHWNGQDVLQWNGHALHDTNADGKLDFVLLGNEPVYVCHKEGSAVSCRYSSRRGFQRSNNQKVQQWMVFGGGYWEPADQKFYDKKVAAFKRDEVHKLWQARWH